MLLYPQRRTDTKQLLGGTAELAGLGMTQEKSSVLVAIAGSHIE